jgi:hypothetical protein
MPIVTSSRSRKRTILDSISWSVRGSAGGTRGTGEISGSDGRVQDRFYDNKEYGILASEQNNALRLKHMKCGHVGKPNSDGGGGSDNNGGGNAKSDGKSIGKTIKSSARTIAALCHKVDLMQISDEDESSSSDDDAETATAPNRTHKNLSKDGG